MNNETTVPDDVSTDDVELVGFFTCLHVCVRMHGRQSEGMLDE